jgi:two-component system, cell cycle response regulator DivK
MIEKVWTKRMLFESIDCQILLEKTSLILVVDNNEDNLLLMAHIVKPFACRLLTARNGEEALSLAKMYVPELILLEIALPDLDGTELVANLKQNKFTKNIPIVAVTELARKEERERILRAGCDGYISKPYMLEDIETIIGNYIRKNVR